MGSIRLSEKSCHYGNYKERVNVGNSHIYDMEKLYVRLLVVLQHRYIYLSDLWERIVDKLCSVHSMYLWERSVIKPSSVHSMYKVDSQAVQWYTWLLVAGS